MKRVLADVWSYVAFALMLIGITGLSFETFRDGGWGERLLGAVWAAEIKNPLMMTPVLIGGFVLVVLFLRGGLTVGKGHPLSDFFVYALMALGAFFLIRWLT
jgi:hypothetical protein